MQYPRLQASQTSREMIDIFRGYNHNLRVSDGEFYEMENMTSDFSPVLSPRGKRGVYKTVDGLTGIIAKNKLCYTVGSRFVIGNTVVEMGLDPGTDKELVSMGAYVIILPDKKYINTMNTKDRGDIEASFVSGAAVTFRLCSITGEVITPATVAAKAPENPANGALWMDTSSKPNALKQYSESSASSGRMTNFTLPTFGSTSLMSPISKTVSLFRLMTILFTPSLPSWLILTS